MLQVAFAGTPEFAVPTLQALLSAPDITVKCVLTQPDRPAGRGQQMSESAVKRCARDAGIDVWQPEQLSLPEHAETLRTLHLDVLVVVAFGQLLKPIILDIPRYGCINVHASLLPRWRGAAPVQRAIEAGDSETGVTIMQMDAGLDTGPMLAKQAIAIEDSTTAADLHDQLARIGGPLLVDTLRAIREHRHVPVPQTDDARATYAKKIRVEDACIQWDQSAEYVLRQIHAFNPYPGAYCYLNAERLKIFEVAVRDTHRLSPGQWQRHSDGSVMIGTGTVPLECLALQFPGQKRLTTSQMKIRKGLPWDGTYQLSRSPSGGH